MEKVKQWFGRVWIWLAAAGTAILAFFSYSYYQKTKAASDRVSDHNADQAAVNKDLKENVEDLHAAQDKLNEAVNKVDAVELAVVEKTNSVEESTDNWNNHK